MRVTEMIDQIRAYQKELGYTFEFETVEEQMEHARNIALALQIEVAEAVNWMPWKPWRPAADQEFNQAEAAEEIIDIFFFTVNLWLTLGLPASSFRVMFEAKLKENLDRIRRGYNHKAEKTAKGENS